MREQNIRWFPGPGNAESCVGYRYWEREILRGFLFLGARNTGFQFLEARNPLAVPVSQRVQSSMVSLSGNVESFVVSCSCGARNLLLVSVPRKPESCVVSPSWEREILCGFLFLGARDPLSIFIRRNA